MSTSPNPVGRLDDPFVGQVFDGRYEIVRPIGEGGMGMVYLAMQEGLDRPVALKLLATPVVGDLGEVERFCLEAAVTARVAHPHIVTIHDSGRSEDGIFFIAMEWLDGRTLAEAIQEEGRLPAHRIVPIARQIARAMRAAHDAGLVHRDLKPANVMLLERADEPDFVKVLDFGLAGFVATSGESTQSGAFLGSPQYMAPELVQGERATQRSDVYSLGVLLYEMACGRAPFRADSHVGVLLEHAHAQVRPPHHLVPDLPPALEQVILRCLHKDPGQRFVDMQAVLDALDGIEAGETTPRPTLLAPAEVASLRIGARRRKWARRLLPWLTALAVAGGAWAALG